MPVRMGMNGRPAVMTFHASYFREESELMHSCNALRDESVKDN